MARAAHSVGPIRIAGRFGLLEKLREQKPSVVIALDENGDQLVKMNVPDVRNRHARVLEGLADVEWVKVQLLDKKGGHLAMHVRNSDDREPATELETIGASRSVGETSGMLSLMLRAQEMVLVRHERSMQQVMEANGKLLDSAMKRLDLLERQYEHAMALNHALSSDLVQSQLQLVAPTEVDEDGNRSQSQITADAAAAAFLPRLAQAMFAGKPAAPAAPVVTNGATPPVQKPKRPAPAPPTVPPAG